jgi:hypothetical protein
MFKILKAKFLQVAHTYNPTYTGGRDQEDRDSKPALANSSRDPILSKKGPRATPPALFGLQIVSGELFNQTGFKPQSSRSLPPE